VKALDIANYTAIPAQEQLTCAQADGYDTLIVGVSYGTVGHQQLAAGANAGMKLEAYSWLKHPFALHKDEMIRAISLIQGAPVERMWIDVEDVGTASPERAQQQVQDIWNVINWWKEYRPNLPLGIYTARWWWEYYMPDVYETFGLPLWMAYYPSTSPEQVDLEAHLPGGWSLDETLIWQYQGSVDTCGLNTDRNFILKGDTRMKYTDTVLDATFGALLKTLGDDGALIASLGNGLGRVATDLYTHIHNNGDFTRPQQVQLDALKAEIDAITARTEKLVAGMKAASEGFNDSPA